MSSKIYEVKVVAPSAEVLTVRLIEAPSRNAALRFVAASTITAQLCTPQRAIELDRMGVTIEKVDEAPSST